MATCDIYLGDCLVEMGRIPSGSVDMVLCDLPYGTMGMGGDGIVHGMKGRVGWDQEIDPSSLFKQYERVLRTNGSCLLFCQEPYTSRMITNAHGNLPFSYRLIWVKDHFANSLSAKKAPVSYFEDIAVFFKKYDTLAQHPLREYSLRVLDHCGGSLKSINMRLGHRRAEHFFYVESTQFGLCTEIIYDQLCDTYDLRGQVWFKPYTELTAIDRTFRRTFNLPQGQKFVSNVLQFRKDYARHHPTQKPVALCEQLIRTYTNPGDTVLDNTMGSGTTGVAALNTVRNFIGIERDPGYFKIAQDRIAKAMPSLLQAAE